MEFFDRYFHIPLPIVTKHELGLPFPPRNLPIKIWYKSIHNLFSYRDHRQTDRQTNIQTDKPMPVKTYSLAFAGITTVIKQNLFSIPSLSTSRTAAWTRVAQCCCSELHWPNKRSRFIISQHHILPIYTIHCLKKMHLTFAHNFGKCRPIS